MVAEENIVFHEDDNEIFFLSDGESSGVIEEESDMEYVQGEILDMDVY